MDSHLNPAGPCRALPPCHPQPLRQDGRLKFGAHEATGSVHRGQITPLDPIRSTLKDLNKLGVGQGESTWGPNPPKYKGFIGDTGYIYILCAYNTYLFFDTGQTSNKVDGWIDRWVEWMIRQSIIIWIGK